MKEANTTDLLAQNFTPNASDTKDFPVDKSKLSEAMKKAAPHGDKGSSDADQSNHGRDDVKLPRDEKTLIPMLKSELDDLKSYGDAVRKSQNGYQRKIQQAAINVLAKCLGIRQKYFKIDDTLLHDKIYAALYEKAMGQPFKSKRKNTTEYHLISRIYRGEERRQVSSDALILQRANDAGQTEQTFAEWVLAEGGLDEIRRTISDERKAKNSNNGKLKKKISKGAGTERFIKLFNDLDRSGHVQNMTVLEKDEMHALFGSWIIWEPENSVPIVVYPRKDGKFQIRKIDLNTMRTNNPS